MKRHLMLLLLFLLAPVVRAEEADGMCVCDLLPAACQGENYYGLHLGLTGKHGRVYGVDLASLGMTKRLNGLAVGLPLYAAVRANGIMVGPYVIAKEMNGVQVGLLTGFLNVGGCRDVYVRGVQCGLLTFGDDVWAQLGLFNLETSGYVQTGLANFNCGLRGIQFGLYNHIESRATGLQIGLINYFNEEVPSSLLQLGLLNRTASGWWLPISNFGL